MLAAHGVKCGAESSSKFARIKESLRAAIAPPGDTGASGLAWGIFCSLRERRSLSKDDIN
jgi:hypothetical protein